RCCASFLDIAVAGLSACCWTGRTWGKHALHTAAAPDSRWRCRRSWSLIRTTDVVLLPVAISSVSSIGQFKSLRRRRGGRKRGKVGFHPAISCPPSCGDKDHWTMRISRRKSDAVETIARHRSKNLPRVQGQREDFVRRERAIPRQHQRDGVVEGVS